MWKFLLCKFLEKGIQDIAAKASPYIHFVRIKYPNIAEGKAQGNQDYVSILAC